MCSPAVRLGGTDRWPLWLALAGVTAASNPLGSDGFPRPSQNQFSLRQGEGGRIRSLTWSCEATLAGSVPLLPLTRKRQTGRKRRRRGGRWRVGKGWCDSVYITGFKLTLFYLAHFFQRSLSFLRLSLHKWAVSQTQQVAMWCLFFPSDFRHGLCLVEIFSYPLKPPWLLPATELLYSKQTAASAGNVKCMTSPVGQRNGLSWTL